MLDFTSLKNNTSKVAELKEASARPQKDTLFFLRLFARVYEPVVKVAI